MKQLRFRVAPLLVYTVCEWGDNPHKPISTAAFAHEDPKQAQARAEEYAALKNKEME